MNIEDQEVIFDLVYSHADKGYIAVPRDNRTKPREDLWTFDSRQASGMYACTKIPTGEILEVLARHKRKFGEPLAK